MKLETGQQVDRFTVLNTLGHGGMSDVYRARDEEHIREVVLKFPHEEMMGDPATYERFCREVQIGNFLTHPNIQKLYELAGDKHDPYLVLEYVPGSTLRDVLRLHAAADHGRLPIGTAVSIGVQIAKALEYAHAKQVFHRDMKPENVIVTPDGVAKVMDFGIAFMEGARRITWGRLSSQVGTPDYMAPEQIKGQRGDQRTDIYALGMMLYECVTGCLPYEGDNSLAVMNQHVTVSPPPLHTFFKEVPGDLEEVILKAIRRSPASRWASMQAFREALENPKSVDTAALRVEREQEETDTQAGSGFNNELGLHGWQIAAITLFTVVGLVALVAILSLVHHPH